MKEYIVKKPDTDTQYRILAASAKKARKTACHLDGQTEDKYTDYKVVETKKLTKKGALRQQNSGGVIAKAITFRKAKINISHTRDKCKGVVYHEREKQFAR